MMTKFIQKKGILAGIQYGVVTVLLILCCSACEKEQLFLSGPMQSREYSVSDFTHIEIRGVFDIHIVPDTVHKVWVHCGRGIQESVRLEGKSNRLVVSAQTRFDWSRKYEKIRLDIHLPQLDSVYIYQACNIQSSTTISGDQLVIVDWTRFSEMDIELDYRSLQVHVSSDHFGEYRFHGQTDFALFRTWGSTYIDAGELQTRACAVAQRSIRDTKVWVNQHLEVGFESSGNVILRGDPTITVTGAGPGTGKIIQQ